MSWFSKIVGSELTLDTLEKLLEMQLRDLYSAEIQLISALPKMAEAATNPLLKNAFRSHLAETKQQKMRIEKAFSAFGKKAKDEKCDAMKGLIAEGQEVIDAEGDSDVKDAALIAAAQRVEHYEIAGYGCARTFAPRLNQTTVAKLLQTTLEEEAQADKKLTQIAEKSVNSKAASHGSAKNRNGRARSISNGRAAGKLASSRTSTRSKTGRPVRRTSRAKSRA
jgi:ferritin-like metal-binding protein YciE